MYRLIQLPAARHRRQTFLPALYPIEEGIRRPGTERYERGEGDCLKTAANFGRHRHLTCPEARREKEKEGG